MGYLGGGHPAVFVVLEDDFGTDLEAEVAKRLPRVARQLVEREGDTQAFVGGDFAQAEIIDMDDCAAPDRVLSIR